MLDCKWTIDCIDNFYCRIWEDVQNADGDVHGQSGENQEL